MTARHDKAACLCPLDDGRRCLECETCQGYEPPDKTTDEITEAAAVAQAIADLEKALRWMAEYRMTGTEQTLHIDFQGKAIEMLPALRVLADAIEEFRLSLYSRDILLSLANARETEAAEAERDKWMRQALANARETEAAEAERDLWQMHNTEAHERAERLAARVEELEAALRYLLEWAEKDRGGGYPEADRSEEWYTHRDFARAALNKDTA